MACHCGCHSCGSLSPCINIQRTPTYLPQIVHHVPGDPWRCAKLLFEKNLKASIPHRSSNICRVVHHHASDFRYRRGQRSATGRWLRLGVCGLFVLDQLLHLGCSGGTYSHQSLTITTTLLNASLSPSASTSRTTCVPNAILAQRTWSMPSWAASILPSQ